MIYAAMAEEILCAGSKLPEILSKPTGEAMMVKMRVYSKKKYINEINHCIVHCGYSCSSLLLLADFITQ